MPYLTFGSCQLNGKTSPERFLKIGVDGNLALRHIGRVKFVKTLESMNTDLTGKVAAAESKVDATVAAKLAQATAAIGAPAQPVVPATAATPQALTGMARVRAAAKADLEKAGYVAKRQ